MYNKAYYQRNKDKLKPTVNATRTGLQDKNDLNYYSLKMLRDCLTTTKEKPSERCSFVWMRWGTMLNGRCLTARISYHKTGRESSLSDILETNPHPKYFLSQKSIKSTMAHAERHKKKGNGFGVNIVTVFVQDKAEVQNNMSIQSMPTTQREGVVVQ